MEAVIFDMDGVIVDSEPLHFQVETALFQELGIRLSHGEHAEFLGTSSREMFSALRQRFSLSESVEELMQEERRRYLNLLRNSPLPLNPGIPELVDRLKDGAYSIALASSAPEDQISLVLERSGLASKFEIRVSGDSVARSKPHPEIFLNAAADLGVKPSSCWVIEDSANGIRAAVAAGMRTIAYSRPDAAPQNLDAADYRSARISAIGEIIMGASGDD